MLSDIPETQVLYTVKKLGSLPQRSVAGFEHLVMCMVMWLWQNKDVGRPSGVAAVVCGCLQPAREREGKEEHVFRWFCPSLLLSPLLSSMTLLARSYLLGNILRIQNSSFMQEL